jgi:hypothetical protein
MLKVGIMLKELCNGIMFDESDRSGGAANPFIGRKLCGRENKVPRK